MPDKVTAPKVASMKRRGDRIVCVTAYDATSGAICEAAGVDVVLVGDSMGNVVMGLDTTVPVEMTDIVHHLRATRTAVRSPLLVADLPFGAYQSSVERAFENAATLMKNGAEAVKLEGDYPDVVSACAKAGVPTMGHLGFTPQSINAFGGFRVQGKGESGDRLLEQAKRLQDAGCFAIVLELVPAALAARVTQELVIPTIGIGAGPICDGEIQVFHDVVGLSPRPFKHSKAFVKARALMVRGLKRYASDVRDRSFPTEENSF